MKEQRRVRLAGRFGCLVMASTALAISPPALAECFCLAHPVTGQVAHYGCEARAIPNRISERVTCLDATRTGRAAISDSATFTRIPEGAGVCNPCAPPANSTMPDFLRRPDGNGPEESGGGEPDG